VRKRASGRFFNAPTGCYTVRKKRKEEEGKKDKGGREVLALGLWFDGN